MKLLKTLLFLVLLAESTTVNLAQTYLVGGYDYPPFVYAKATQGIYVDLVTELSKVSQQSFKWEHYPYARLDALFTKASVHIEVGSSPLWTASKRVPGFYTVPFYILKDVVVFRRGKHASMKSFSDLQGKRVGLVRGYSFPQFQKAFDDGTAIRIDAANELALMKLLINNRVDQIFISQDLFLYHQKANKKFNSLVPGDIVGSYEVAIRVHPKYKSLVSILNEGIEALKDRGVIKAIINKHLH